MIKKILAILAAIGGVLSSIFFVLFKQAKEERKAEEEREQRGKDAEAKKRAEAKKKPTTPDESSIKVNKNGFYMRELRNNGTMSKEVTCKKNEQTRKYELSETIVTVLNGETSVNTKCLQLTRAQFNELMAKALEGAKLQLNKSEEKKHTL